MRLRTTALFSATLMLGLLLVGCDTNADATSSAKSVVKAFYRVMETGNSEGLAAVTTLSGENERFMAMAIGFIRAGIQKEGGINRIEVIRIDRHPGSNKATATVKLYYGNGTTDQQQANLVQTDDGRWLVAIGDH